MKNEHIERLKREAKLFHRANRQPRFQDGLVVRHLYDKENPQKVSWWDDVGFVLNDYLVNVAWVHPRYAYKDQAEEVAYQACAHLRTPSVDDMFHGEQPNYLKVGKSRKKIASYTMKSHGAPEYFDALQAAETRIARDPANGITIRPSVTTEWTNWSRFVCLCAPIEVRDVSDLHLLANLVKRLLKRETSLAQEFPAYVYTQKNWITEFQESDVIGVLSHAVNG